MTNVVGEEFNELMLKAKYWEGFLDGKLAGMEEYERLQKPGYALGVLLKLANQQRKETLNNG